MSPSRTLAVTLLGAALWSASGAALGTPGRPAVAPASDDDGPVRFSLPTASDRAVWREAGFRLELGLSFGDLVGLGGAPSGLVYGAVLRLGARLDESWSLLGSLQYAVASSQGGLSGLRFSGTLEPTWHPWPNLSLSIGLGFGGLSEGQTGRTNPDPLPETLDTSYTFVDARHPLPSCSGVGLAALVRAESLFVLGPRSSTGLALEVSGQWTGCVEDTGRVEPDTARPIERRQWWPHVGGTVAWMVAWR